MASVVIHSGAGFVGPGMGTTLRPSLAPWLRRRAFVFEKPYALGAIGFLYMASYAERSSVFIIPSLPRSSICSWIARPLRSLSVFAAAEEPGGDMILLASGNEFGEGGCAMVCSSWAKLRCRAGSSWRELAQRTAPGGTTPRARRVVRLVP